MRQTRRSRSAATPQKDEGGNQVEDVKGTDKNLKVNLGTVFEKDGDVIEEVGTPVESNAGEVKDDMAEEVVLLGENVADGDEPADENAVVVEEGVANDETLESEKASEESQAKLAGSPKKVDSGVVELNCKVCDCSFTNYQEHMNSDAHKSKIGQTTPKTEAQGTASQAQKRSGDQDAAPAAKRMKNLNTQNVSTEKFHCEVCKLTMVKQQDFDHHMNGKRHLLNMTRAQGKAYCDICKLFFNTLTDLNDHSESQLHKSTLAERKQDKQPYECKSCNITSIGQRQHEQHLQSKRHKKSLERPAGSVPNAVNGKAETKPNEAAKKWLYMCNACSFGCSLDQEFTAHMNLAEHKAAVIDMKKKGVVLEKGAANKPGVAKANANKPAGPKPGPHNVRKFPGNNAPGGPRNFSAPAGALNVAPRGPVTKVTYNIVSGPNVNAAAAAAAKPMPLKKDGPAAIRKGPVGGPGGIGGPRKNMTVNMPANMPVNKPNMPVNKPPMSGRPNPRFQGQAMDNMPNKFAPNAQPMKLGYQKMQFDAPVKFGPAFGSSNEPMNAGGNYGNYNRAMGNYGNMRNDAVNLAADNRDFRGNVRDEYRADARDIRDIRDIRSIDLGGDNRADTGFRSGFYRDVPVDAGRDIRGDFGNNFRSDMAMDTRSDIRSAAVAAGPDTRDMRSSVARSDLSGDLRSYASSDMRDLRSDTRSDYMRDRNTMSGYGASTGYSQSSYRGNDDYRPDNYGRAGQSSGQAAASGNYSAGMMAGGRYDNYDRNSSAYSNQYGASSSRGMGYMGDMALNGR